MMNNCENDDKQIEKRFGAMRIFEALSSVDEDLLVRADEQNKVIPIRRATRVMAACACLMVVGLVTWTGSRMLLTKDNTSSDCAVPESGNQMAADTTGKGADGAEEMGVAEESIRDIMDEAAETDIADIEDESMELESMKSESQSEMEEVGAPMQEAMEYRSLEELRAIEGLGDYIPTEIPAGYVFESGYETFEVGEAGGISLRWSKGMDDIQIFVTQYEMSDETERRIVDVSKPETYDVSLYEIPYCDSLPDEYREIFENPIFMESNLSLEIVNARMKSVEDQGDTDTPRGNFAVLYDSGVLVKFNGECDVESIWEMFQSIGN